MERFYRRVLNKHLSEERQMLFIMGPRQAGKTSATLALEKDWPNLFYFNWDNIDERDKILSGPNSIVEHVLVNSIKDAPVVIFDEIHKYSKWKIFLKGLYDSFPSKIHIVVTGSARLDVYHKSGDSLMGRYFGYHFHPFTVAECINKHSLEGEIQPPFMLENDIFESLWHFGGYPDPLLRSNERFFTRWQNSRFQQLMKEDIRDLSRVQEIGQLELLAKLLQNQVGCNTTYSSLSKKIRVTDNTIRNWIEVLESLYYCFSVRPWSKNVVRSLIKEPKIYLWDWSLCKDEGMRAENFIALHLLKAVHFWTDYGFGSYGLHYLRDKQKKEVDFLVTKDNRPWFLVEVKYNESSLSPNLQYYQDMLNVPHAFQVVIDMPFIDKDCFAYNYPVVVPARTFLSQLI